MDTPPSSLRHAVRDALLAAPAFQALTTDQRGALAQCLVKVCHVASSLANEQQPDPAAKATRPPVALAQSAASEFSGVAADRVAGTTRAILNAVSFPRFVTDLINGVFKAMIDSNHQQMNSYVELIQNVAASTDGFADANLAPARARQWLMDTFPGSFEVDGDEELEPGEPDEEARLRWRSDAARPSEAAMRAALGLDPTESVPTGDPETTLVPFARRALARQRQQVLATMVMMGMQRIVIESGRLNAAMRFHIDTRSAAASESGSRFDLQNKVDVSGKYGLGPWGVDAKMSNTIGYVSTQKTQSTEEMNTDLDLNSSVELYFKTDYLPLDRMAGKGQIDRIKDNTLNPATENDAAATAREARTKAARDREQKAMSDLNTTLTQPPANAPATDTQPNSQRRTGQTAQQSPPGETTGPHSSPGQGAAGGTTNQQNASAQPTQGQPPPGQSATGVDTGESNAGGGQQPSNTASPTPGSSTNAAPPTAARGNTGSGSSQPPPAAHSPTGH